jgi:hypothetical protein
MWQSCKDIYCPHPLQKAADDQRALVPLKQSHENLEVSASPNAAVPTVSFD